MYTEALAAVIMIELAICMYHDVDQLPQPASAADGCTYAWSRSLLSSSSSFLNGSLRVIMSEQNIVVGLYETPERQRSRVDAGSEKGIIAQCT